MRNRHHLRRNIHATMSSTFARVMYCFSQTIYPAEANYMPSQSTASDAEFKIKCFDMASLFNHKSCL